jgi:hypothetical protein
MTAGQTKPLVREISIRFPDHAEISKTSEINFENVARIALRHSEIFGASRNPFMPV